jgi:tRNA(Ile)-lysidine synthase
MAAAPGTPRPPPKALVARVRRFARDHELIAPGDRVLVAVSGGPDSTCLLLILAALRRSLRFELHVAYFDHGLRGVSAGAREERFVRALAGQLDAKFHAGRGDVRAHARARRRSIEDAARELRYRFLARTARRHGCAAVVTGHTRDDQAETVLLHLLRGAGLRGLAGIAPSSAWPFPARDAPALVRPLLVLSRRETEACCKAAGVVPLRDPSNRSPAFLRNRVRRDLLPQLRRYNPRVDEALARLAGAAADDIGLLESLAADALGAQPARDGVVRLSRARLAALPPALQRHAVRLAVARALGDGRDLSERHVGALLRAARGPTGASLDLTRGLRAAVTRDALVLSTTRRPLRALPAKPAPLPVPGRTDFGGWSVEAKLLARWPSRLVPGDNSYVYLDATACGPRLAVRRRRPGDRFHPLGLARPKKLQDYFVDAHVPREERDAIPLVANDRGIVWIAGQRPAEWAKVKPVTKRVVRLSAVPRRA